MKHLLKLKDLDQREILDILNLADQLKYETKHGIEHHHLKGKTLGMIFQKSSTRTRVSFETGMYQHFSFQTGICKSAGANLLKILQEFFPVTLTVL